MTSRAVFVGVLSLLFFGFGAWAQTTGIITGEVIDSDTGESIFGARITDVTDEAKKIPGSFAGNGDYFIRDVPVGPRTVELSAEGYPKTIAQVQVDVEPFARLDFELVFTKSDNTAEITLPIGQSGELQFLFPPIVEAVQDGVVVGRTFVRAGNQYRISGIPNGTTTFRSASAYYDVGTRTIFLSEGGTFNVTLPVSAPGTRGGPITGSVAGVVKDLLDSPIAAHVYATFTFEGSPVTATIDSGMDGIYLIALLPAGGAEIKAHAISTTDRSPPPPGGATTIVGAMVATKDLFVFPFDPMTANFIPIVESHPAVVVDEDDPRVLIIGDFTVTDLDDPFSAAHTLVINPGFNYTRSNPQSKITPDLDWNGSLAVPVIMSDGTNNSAPFILTVTVTPVSDPTVYVDIDNGASAGAGGTGSAANPFQAVGEALSAVTAAGTILIQGVASSTEAPLTINQDVSLQIDNSDADDLVRIAPTGARQATSTASPVESGGFVTRSRRPR